MRELITDEMVETAARASYADWAGEAWDRADDYAQREERASVRAALEAVAPLIAATARAETTTEATERIARQIAATSAMTGRDALGLVEAVQALQNAETTTDLHWSNAAAAEYPGDEYEQYPLRTAFGRGVKWERRRAAVEGALA